MNPWFSHRNHWEKNIAPYFEKNIPENPKQPLYPLFHTCHQIQFEKNPMNKFRKAHFVDFGPKDTPFTPFWA